MKHTIAAGLVLLAQLVTSGAILRAEVLRVPEDEATLTDAVAAISDGGTIDMAGGTYFSPVPNGFWFATLAKGFTIRGREGETVWLDGGGSYPVLRVESSMPGKWIRFENLGIRNGYSTSQTVGGGATLLTAQATFVDVEFANNASVNDTSGGGGAVVGVGATALYVRCTFRDNTATGTGAGLRVSGDSTVWIHESEFERNLLNEANHRPSSQGAGINLLDSDMWITNTRFENNEAGWVGGAIQAKAFASPVTLVIANSAFIGNKAEPYPGNAHTTATSGGAIHIEDLADVAVYNSRFDLNEAEAGGAISGYRGKLDVWDSVFRGNRAVGSGTSGLGGALAFSSNDTTADGANNFRSSEVSVRDSLIQGRWGGTTIAGTVGGGIFVSGDSSREYGINGVTQQATPANRAKVTLERVVLHDLDVEQDGVGTGLGGAANLTLSDLSILNTIVTASDAGGTAGTAGGIRIAMESVGSITSSTFAENTADAFGGALVIEGSDIAVSSTSFHDNEISPGVSESSTQSFGAAVFTGIRDNAFGIGGLDFDNTSELTGNVFSRNVGLAIYEDDRIDAPDRPKNLTEYDANDFYETTFGTDVYRSALTPSPSTPAELNTLVLHGTAKSPSADNSTLVSAPTLGHLLAVPSQILSVTTPNEGITATRSFLGYAWNGPVSALLNGGTITANAGAQETLIVGTNTLSVSGTDFDDAVTAGATPMATMTATPEYIESGESSTLDWATPGGTFIWSRSDFGVATGGLASSSVNVMPGGSQTYTYLAVTEEGGAHAEARVFVDETPPEVIFIDGFESGDTSAWD